MQSHAISEVSPAEPAEGIPTPSTGPLPSEAVEQYRREGILRVPGLAPPSLSAHLFETLCGALRVHAPDAPHGLKSRGWEDPEFNSVLVDLRQRAPKRFALMYDTVQTSLSLQAVGCNPTLCQHAAQLLGDSPNGLSATDHLLRMDAPRDQRNILRWHQDSAYFRQNARGENGLVCWVPLHDFPKELGPVWICQGSHRLGRLNVASKKPTTIASEQFEVEEQQIHEFQRLQATAKAGDVYFMNMDTVHRSGENTTTQFRFTAIVRFHRMFADDFVPGRLVYRRSRVLDE